MKLRDKADRIREQLHELYADAPPPLHHTNAFTLLVAVLLSAQATDVSVNAATPALFARASTPLAMSKLSQDEILALVRTINFAPTKAKNILALSKKLVDEHDGVVPRTFEELEALPGIGHKSASVVMSQAFGLPAFPVDTHIHRLAERWGLSDGTSVEQTEKDLKALFPESTWREMHVAIILFGREHCPALRHDDAACPICSWAADPKLVAASRAAREAKAGAPNRRAKLGASARKRAAPPAKLVARAKRAPGESRASKPAMTRAKLAGAKAEVARGKRAVPAKRIAAATRPSPRPAASKRARR